MYQFIYIDLITVDVYNLEQMLPICIGNYLWMSKIDKIKAGLTDMHSAH